MSSAAPTSPTSASPKTRSGFSNKHGIWRVEGQYVIEDGERRANAAAAARFVTTMRCRFPDASRCTMATHQNLNSSGLLRDDPESEVEDMLPSSSKRRSAPPTAASSCWPSRRSAQDLAGSQQPPQSHPRIECPVAAALDSLFRLFPQTDAASVVRLDERPIACDRICADPAARRRGKARSAPAWSGGASRTGRVS